MKFAEWLFLNDQSICAPIIKSNIFPKYKQTRTTNFHIFYLTSLVMVPLQYLFMIMRTGYKHVVLENIKYCIDEILFQMQLNAVSFNLGVFPANDKFAFV
jgi:hypothetical protein